MFVCSVKLKNISVFMFKKI